jgi:vancomycin resistance protein VanJ
MGLRRTSGKVAAVAVWLYLAVLIGTWLALWLGTDRWVLATVVGYGPRWVFFLPQVVLLPVAILVRRWRLLVVLGAAAAVCAFPIMGCCVPLGFPTADEPTLRVLTCNVGGGETDAAAVGRLIRDVRPDVVLLQECGTDTAIALPEGWNVAEAGQLRVATPFPIGDRQSATNEHLPGKRPPLHALYVAVETPYGRIGVCNVHLRTPRRGIASVLDRHTIVSPSRKHVLEEEIEYRRRESGDLAQWIEGFSDPLIIAGDFNMPPDSTIYRRYWGKYANAFSTAGMGLGRTRWTTVRWLKYGVRIDHILTDSHWHTHRCRVGYDVGSDHLPVIADVWLEVDSSTNNPG